MRKSIPMFILPFALAGCALFGGGKDTAPPSNEPAQAPIPEESKDAARAGEEQMIAAQKAMDADIDTAEAEIKKALELALGQRAAYQGGQNPYPASEAIAELRKAKIDVWLEPVLGADGKPVGGDQYMQLSDSYTTKVQKLSRKISEGKASKKDMKFVQNGAKHVVKINDLKSQVSAATIPALTSGWMVTTGSMTTMSTVSGLVRNRRQMEMEWTERDYELVQELLARQRRREALAAVSIGLLASYQAAVNPKGDPKILDDVAKGTLEALPLTGEATIEEAKAYVENFDANAEAAHQQYEAQMRTTMGDAEYESKYKANIDRMFTQIKGASSAKSASQLMADTQAKYREDLEKCARGEKPDPGGMVGPGACKEAKAKADGAGKLSPEALSSLLGGPASVDEAKGAGIRAALGAIPGGDQIERALGGVKALRQGDPSQALQLAADLVPLPGPAKMALNAAAKLSKALPRLKQFRDRAKAAKRGRHA